MNGTRTILIALSFVAIGLFSGVETTKSEAQNKFQLRWGWFSNPTPGNAWLLDKEGDWIIGIQGGYQAAGDWPDINDAQWVNTNGHYGYGCACIRASADKQKMRVIEIRSGFGRRLSACRKDKTLKEPKEEGRSASVASELDTQLIDLSFFEFAFGQQKRGVGT